MRPAASKEQVCFLLGIFPGMWAHTGLIEKGSEKGGWTGPHSTLGLRELSVEGILPWERIWILQNLGR